MAKKPNTIKHRNADARALFHRAGNAGCAVAVDTRPKSVPDKRKFSKSRDRKQARAALKSGLV